MRMTHLRLLVDEFDACFRWYRDVLGLRPFWGEEGSGYADFKAGEGSSDLALFSRSAQVEVSGSLGGGDRDRVALVFRVDDVDRTAQAMRAMGVAVIAGPKDQPGWGIRTLHLRDPDGNVVELNSPLPADRWSEDLRADAQRFEEQYAGRRESESSTS
ncbi:VOC family protein [Actinopolymorpha sp. B11F2]|uniref:VOC family protein n=1 Tax=Actinopolymorpha sp. B11F2 TaxID=3160862 RepID=UPI0032E3AD1C